MSSSLKPKTGKLSDQAFKNLIDRLHVQSATALELAIDEAWDMDMGDVYDMVSSGSQNDLERIAEEVAKIKLEPEK